MLIGKPKPTKKDRKLKEEKSRKSLKEYRQKQYEIATFRDDGYCVFCYFLHGTKVVAVDCHHVYGRANKSGKDMSKEHYSMIVCTCRDCHPQPIKDKNPSPDMQWIEDTRAMANKTPINKLFKASEYGSAN